MPKPINRVHSSDTPEKYRIYFVRRLACDYCRHKRTGFGWDWFYDAFVLHDGAWVGVVAAGGSAPSRPAARTNARRSMLRSREEWDALDLMDQIYAVNAGLGNKERT